MPEAWYKYSAPPASSTQQAPAAQDWEALEHCILPSETKWTEAAGYVLMLLSATTEIEIIEFVQQSPNTTIAFTVMVENGPNKPE